MIKKALFSVALLVVWVTLVAQEGGSSCGEMTGICTDSGVQFTANSDGPDALTSEPGNNYGCLGSAPNPTWYFLEIDQPGDIIMSLSAPQDIDFIIWGPYPNLAAAQANCGNHNTIVPNTGDFFCQFLGIGCTSYGCSYSLVSNETPGIPNGQTGQVYVMLVTNFANTVQNITLTQTGGAGTTDCSVIEPDCLITGIDVNVSACDLTTFTYSTTGTVTYVNPPSGGQLIVEDCNGNQQVINPPFTGSSTFTFSDQPANGEACDVNAWFTMGDECSFSLGGYTAPTCTCLIDNLTVSTSACNEQNNTYSVNGSVSFSGAPLTGSMTVTACSGQSQTFNAPFASPLNYSIPGLLANGLACDVTVSFSDNQACFASVNFTAPQGCGCQANVGSFATSLGGQPIVDGSVTLCIGDEFTVVSTGGFVPPPNINSLLYNYNPGLWLLVYDCPPTVFPYGEINDDPCLVGVYSTANGDWTIPNTEGEGETLYFVPLTMYDNVDGWYSVTNSTIFCYDLGPAFEVTFLPVVEFDLVEDCQEGTASVTLTGGSAAVDGSLFEASQLAPPNAFFVSQTALNGEAIVIGGLQDGQNYGFVVTDAIGCSTTISGGPYEAAETPEIDVVGELCSSAGAVQLTAMPAGGVWEATCGACLSADGVFDPALSGGGEHGIGYTLDGECGGSSAIIIEVVEELEVTIEPIDELCAADQSVQLVASPVGGVWTADCGACINASGVFSASTAGAGNFNITYTIAGDCGGQAVLEVDVISVAQSTITPIGPLCEDSVIIPLAAASAGGIWTASCGGCINAATGAFDPALAGVGDWAVTYEIEGFCGSSSNINVAVIDPADASISPVEPLCAGEAPIQMQSVTPGGVWTATCGACITADGLFNPLAAGEGQHEVTYSLTLPCLTQSTAVVDVLPLPEVLFAVDDPAGCVPHATVFTAFPGDDVVSCQWSFGNGIQQPSCGEGTTVYLTPGCFDITVTMTNENGCSSTVVNADMVCAYALPISSFAYTPVRPTFNNSMVTLTEFAQGALSYEWIVNGNVVATTPQHTFDLLAFGGTVVPVCLRVTSNNGCIDEFCRDIELSESLSIYVPTAFTPDQDGVNEVWVPVVLGANSYECSVYNRWGQRVFYSETPGEPWLGEVQGGDYFSPDGVYIWHIKVVGEDFDTRELKGHVVILR